MKKSSICLAFAAGLILSCGVGFADQIIPTAPLMADDTTPAPPPPPPPSPYQPAPPPSGLNELDYQKSMLPPGGTSPWQYEFSMSAGYSYFHFSDAKSNTFYNQSGPYFDGNFAFPLPNHSSPIVGFGVSVTSHWENKDFANAGTLYSDVSLVSFEGRVAFPIPTDSSEGLFCVPRIGVGLLLNNYNIETPAGGNSSYTSYHNGFAVDVRPNIEAGYRWSDSASAGIEASYMAGWGGFGNLGSMVTEARIGAVINLRF
jgi:hypothetical protein